MLRDVWTSVKLLWKDRGFSATAILTLAICLGANIAIFTVLDSVVLRPLPVAEADRLVFISNQYPGAGVPEIYSVGVTDYLDRKRDFTDVFEQEGMYRDEEAALDVNGTPERLDGMRISPSMFPLWKVAPATGRAFAEEDAVLGNEQKVILTYGLWHRVQRRTPNRQLRIRGCVRMRP